METVATDNDQELLDAVRSGDVANVKKLFKAGADVNARDNYRNTALMRAAGNGSIEIAKALIEAGADVDAENDIIEYTVLMFAAQNGHTDV